MNIHAYLDRQRNEDRRAFVIHYPANTGKTRFAKRISETRNDTYLLDLQAYFLQHSLPSITLCDVLELKRILLSLDVVESVVLVDNPDFLLNTWNDGQKRTFLTWLSVELRSPARTDKTLVFVIQSDEVIATADIHNSYGEPRVLALDEFEVI